MRSGNLFRAAVAFVAVAALAWYYFRDPAVAPAPRCLLQAITGYDCPGCGTQRALHAILHARVGEAWAFNPAVFFAVPMAALYLLADRLPRFVQRVLYAPAFILAVAAAILAWWIGRNL